MDFPVTSRKTSCTGHQPGLAFTENHKGRESSFCSKTTLLPFFVLFFAAISGLLFSVPSVMADETRGETGGWKIEFLGKASIETGTSFQGTEVGGLSAIAFDSGSGHYLSLSDDKGEGQPPRYYHLRIELENGRLEQNSVALLDVTTLLNGEGNPFAPARLDPEGLALEGNNSFYLASEGVSSSGAPPLIGHFNNRKRLDGTLEVPTEFIPSKDKKKGVRANFGFEALTLSPGGSFLTTATENSLVQDGPGATHADRSPCRLIRFDLREKQVAGQYIYMTEPVTDIPSPPSAANLNGLVELIALDETENYLALERSYSYGKGFSIRLYLSSTGGADNVNGLESINQLNREPVAMKKEQLLDLADLGIRLDNLEGATLGPHLDASSRLLILVSDNNFNYNQFTQFLAFRLRFP